MEDRFEMIATTLYGLEDVLSGELEELGASVEKKGNRALRFHGDISTLYMSNLCLRTASRILVPLIRRRVMSDRDLYALARDVDWKKHMTVRDTFAVSSVANSPRFRHSNYVSLKVKDAIADQFRDAAGRRPSVDRERPALQVNVHIDRDICTISLDSSGAPLHRRGYRLEGRGAPLNEALAAGMILLAGWDGRTSFIDPMCGSGTLPIEAAMIASRFAPGLLRGSFGFMRWPGYDRKLFERIFEETGKKATAPRCSICGSDISKRAVETARKNAGRTPFKESIRFSSEPFEKASPPPPPGVVMMNPPYGRRMGGEDLIDFYKSIGDIMKSKYQGYEAWIISGNREALKFVGLRPSKKHTLYNGPVECRFQRYELYRGSKKAKYNTERE